MNFGETLFKLRKEKGFSQESLAERLGTTRQAISKWENNQGYPETEKLLQLSNIFEVSVDYLLKPDKHETPASSHGYYVSKEFAYGYLNHEKKIIKYVSFCFMFWALTGMPYVMFEHDTTWRILGMAVFVMLGIGSLVLGIFSESDEYNILKKEPLLFDNDFFKELSLEYTCRRKKYILVAIPCTFLFIVGILALVATRREFIQWSQYHVFVFLGFAIGLLGFIQSVGTMDAYELLLKNEAYCNRFLFKVRCKINKRLQ